MTATLRTSTPNTVLALGVAHGAAAQAVGAAAARARAVSLAEVLERAELQVRLDRKYLLAADDFARFSAGLREALDVLEIGGRRSFGYESRYFDTPELLTYRDHLADRPDRFKLRTRTYLDSGQTMFEVKLETPDGGTIKRRTEHRSRDRERITPGARRHLARALREVGRKVPSGLDEACVTSYRRTTFVTRDRSTRITCDHDLVCSNRAGAVSALDRHVIVEVKSARAESDVDRKLAALGVSEVSISKYCVGQALLRPDLPSHRWSAVLKRYFGSVPALAR